MCWLKEFISSIATNTPIKVTTESDDVIIYGQCYKGADRDTTFAVYGIDELINKYGNYVVSYAYIRNNILYIDIDKR